MAPQRRSLHAQRQPMRPTRCLTFMFTVNKHNYAAGLRQTMHAHTKTTISMILRGSIREQTGTRVEIGRPFSIVVKPSGTEHADEFGEVATRTIQIAVDAGTASELTANDPSLGVWRWHHGSPAVRAFLDLAEVCRTSTGTYSDVTVANATADVLGSLCASGRPRGTAPKWLITAREEIDDSVLPRVAEVAAHSSVHPVYFARSFRNYFGCSVTEYLRWRRIQRAAAAISATTRTLSSIAAEAGYSDHAHMCREFRRSIGVSPGEFRARTA
jgi:AraC family transcriptional regulator